MPSSRFIAALNAQETEDQPVMLVTLTHADFTAPLRFCTGGADVTSRLNLFKARAMQITPPGEGEDAPANAKLVLDNIEQDAIAALRGVGAGRPDCLIEMVLADFPDDVEVSYSGLEVIAARPQGPAIEADLIPRDDSEEQFPLQSFAPNRTPGLF
jgi:hypothetical protein